MNYSVCLQESYTYRDPITEFLECLYVNFDFDGAQRKLRECETVSQNIFLYGYICSVHKKRCRPLVIEDDFWICPMFKIKTDFTWLYIWFQDIIMQLLWYIVQLQDTIVAPEKYFYQTIWHLTIVAPLWPGSWHICFELLRGDRWWPQMMLSPSNWVSSVIRK